jgi:hypothetical protein
MPKRQQQQDCEEQSARDEERSGHEVNILISCARADPIACEVRAASAE